MGLSHPQKYTAFAHYICVQDNMFQLKSDHLCRLLCKNSHTVGLAADIAGQYLMYDLEQHYWIG